jgi:hypothetical protein
MVTLLRNNETRFFPLLLHPPPFYLPSPFFSHLYNHLTIVEWNRRFLFSVTPCLSREKGPSGKHRLKGRFPFWHKQCLGDMLHVVRFDYISGYFIFSSYIVSTNILY